MSTFEANNPFDLLGQTAPSAAAVELHGTTEPQLGIGWGQFHQGIASNFAELFRRARVSKNSLLSAGFFKDSWIEGRLPRRAIFAAALWHIAFIAMPSLNLSVTKRNPAFANAQLTWNGPIEDFPLIEIPAARPKSKPRTLTEQPAVESAGAFHPRQRIFTDPVHPTHPRQTLINPAAPQIAPKLLPQLPNIVQLASATAPVRPHLEISKEALKMLHPHEKRVAATAVAPAPEVPMGEQRPSELNLAVSTSAPERPKLEINAGVAPRAAERKQNGAAEPAPDVAAQLTSPNGSGQALIALSATPGPPAPPAGNLSARVSLSPDAKANSSGNSGGEHAAVGTNSVGISIRGGAPKTANTVSGIGSGKIAMPSMRPNYSRAEAARAEDEPAERTAPPNFALLAPDAKPEAIFARRRVYSMNVNMPNLNSATGSWILNFSEIRSAPSGPSTSPTGELAEPSPLRKVDPKYPPTLIEENVEGEVVLYAIIRRDGSVDSIRVVKKLDDQLDANAMRALAQWKFRPAERNGETLELEAIVHIPFHAPPDR
ncbi:MAG TPA: energy transducer TonB [Candidatus Acidoferrum sp.]